MKGYFVTGTDTGVGKTLVSCALLRAFAGQGLRAVGMKPVAAGAEPCGEALVNDDVTALEAASNVQPDRALVNPYCFAPPIAPHIAAAQAGVTIEIERLVAAYRALAARADRVVVEGAGGFFVPLGPTLDTAELARALGAPVILVVGMRLGCLNHALLTAAAIRAAGLRLAGWVANHVDPSMPFADENVVALDERLGAPRLARIAHDTAPASERIAPTLRIDALP